MSLLIPESKPRLACVRAHAFPGYSCRFRDFLEIHLSIPTLTRILCVGFPWHSNLLLLYILCQFVKVFHKYSESISYGPLLTACRSRWQAAMQVKITQQKSSKTCSWSGRKNTVSYVVTWVLSTRSAMERKCKSKHQFISSHHSCYFPLLTLMFSYLLFVIDYTFYYSEVPVLASRDAFFPFSTFFLI